MEAFLLPLSLATSILGLLALALVLRWRHGPPTAKDRALEEARARYARAEISRAEYKRQRREITGRRWRRRGGRDGSDAAG